MIDTFAGSTEKEDSGGVAAWVIVLAVLLSVALLALIAVFITLFHHHKRYTPHSDSIN